MGGKESHPLRCFSLLDYDEDARLRPTKILMLFVMMLFEMLLVAATRRGENIVECELLIHGRILLQQNERD